MRSNVVLETKHLSIGYVHKKQSSAVHTNVNLQLHAGEMVCLVGPNGSGKSTLLRTIAGLQPPLNGEIFIDGKNLTGLADKDMARLRSVVLTNKFDGGYFSVLDLVAMGRYPFMNWMGQLSEKDTAIIEQSIEKAGLAGFADRVLKELSDGELQRAMIAKALAQESPVILLDEPTAHLDLPNRVAVMKLLRNLAKETGTAIVLSTHELDLALQSADRFWLMTNTDQITCGIPEALALSGVIAESFNSKDVHFDNATGVFVMHKSHNGTIGLSGQGDAFLWTKRALERNGFVVDESRNDIEIIEDGDLYLWKTFHNQKSEVFHSLETLINHIIHHTTQNQ